MNLGGNCDSGLVVTKLLVLNAVAVGTRNVGNLALLEQDLRVSTKVASVSVGVKANTVTTAALLDVLLVDGERLDELLLRDVVGENALSQWLGENESLETVTCLLNGLVSLENELVGEQGVVNRETDRHSKTEPLITVLVAYVTTHVCQSDGPGHVDGDGVTVTERREGSKLKGRRDRVAVGNNTVETDLVKVRGLELKHLVDTGPVDPVGSILDLLLSTVGVAESGVDELLGVLVEKVECGQVSTAGDLDQLCEAVPDLRGRKSAEETEVKECVDGGVVCTETVLVVGVVDADLDGDGSVDQANDGCGNADEVGVAAVGSACKSGDG